MGREKLAGDVSLRDVDDGDLHRGQFTRAAHDRALRSVKTIFFMISAPLTATQNFLMPQEPLLKTVTVKAAVLLLLLLLRLM